MRKSKKAIAFMLATVMTLTSLYGCSSAPSSESSAVKADGSADQTANPSETPERMSISIAGLSGGMNSFPVYLAMKNGWFEEENLDVEINYYENGPVQVEAISTWDISCTGIGGILTAAIGYDAQIIAAECSDDGTQAIYARPESAIVAAGKGKNTLNSEIYGDAESWKGAKVLCSAGTVLQYLLIKTLGGIGLSVDDVEFVAMDTATTNSAFLTGEGDVAVLTGVVSFAEDKKDYQLVSSGNMVQTGLDCCLVATEDAIENKKEEITAFLKGYFKAVEWIAENKEAAVADMVAYCDESGKSITADVAKVFLDAEKFYTLEESYRMMTEKAEGSDACITEQRVMDVLKFFIDAGNYNEGDDEIFAGHSTAEFLGAALGK